MQPVLDRAEADVRLRDPLGEADRESADQVGQGAAVAEQGRGDQGQGEPDGVRGAEQGRRGDTAREPPVGAGFAPGHRTQEPAGGGDRAERDPEVGHGLRPGDLGDPQSREQQRGEGGGAGPDDGTPYAERGVQGGRREQREPDAQDEDGRGGRDERRGQEADAAGARRAEEGGGDTRVVLRHVHGLVPPERVRERRHDEHELDEGVGEGYEGEPRDGAGALSGGAGWGAGGGWAAGRGSGAAAGVVMAAAWAPGRVAPASGRPVSGRPVPGRVVGAVGSVSGRAVAVGSGGWARCRRGVEWPGAEGRSAHLGAVVPVSGRAVVAAVGGRASGPDRDVPGPDGDGPDGDADGPGFGWRSGRGAGRRRF